MFSVRSMIVNARESRNAATLSGAAIQATMLQLKLTNTASGSELVAYCMPWETAASIEVVGRIKIYDPASSMDVQPNLLNFIWTVNAN